MVSEYEKIIKALGGEIKILTKVDLAEISKVAGPKVTEGVEKVRKGELAIDPGYDGVYGIVKIWSDDANQSMIEKTPQLGLFDL